MNLSELAKLKIAFVAGTLGQGGAERQLFHMLRALRGCGSDVRVLSLTRGEFWQERIEAIGVPVTWVGENPGRGARLRRIIGELKDFRPDVVQSSHFYTNPYSTVAGRALDIPDIGALRGNGLNEMRIYGPVLGRIGMRWPRVLAANSRAGMEDARTLGVNAQRLHFLPNVIDTEHFCRPAGAERDAGEVWNLVAVGRLCVEKRFDRLIRVAEQLRGLSGRPFRISIVGDGVLRGELETLAAQCGVEDVVRFVGAVADTRNELWGAHAAILTSDFEGTPNVLIEAQSCGLPVISTDIGGVRDVMRDGRTGILIARGDDEELVIRDLVRAAQALREDGEKCALLGAGGRSLVEAECSVARLPLLLGELYRHVLNR